MYVIIYVRDFCVGGMCMSLVNVLDYIKDGNYVEAKTKIYDILKNEKIESNDITLIKNYYNDGKSPYAGYVLYRIYCIKEQYFDAYLLYVELMNQRIKKKDITFLDVTNNADDKEIIKICADIIKKLDEDDMVQSLLISEVIDHIIPRVWASDSNQKYEIISQIAQKLWFGDLKNTNCLYEFAFSCSKKDSELAKKLYLKLVESEPANSKALNQIGLIFEKNNDMKSAQKYFEKAYEICADNEEYRQNLERIYLATR